jgi:hypothetical protein
MSETYIPPQETATPPQTPEDDFAAIQDMQADQDRKRAAEAAQRLLDTPTPAEAPANKHLIRNLAIGTVLTVSAGAGVVGLINEQGGSSNGESLGTVDNTIEAVTLNPDANIRFDPYVGEGDTNNNILHLGAQITIDVNHDARVLDGTNNGTWVGIPLTEVKAVVPNIDTSDKDGIVWVNEQGIKEIKHAQSETK